MAKTIQAAVFTPRAEELRLARDAFDWSFIARASLWDLRSDATWFATARARWVDPGIDGARRVVAGERVADGYGEFVDGIRGADRVLGTEFESAPAKQDADRFVSDLMDRCASSGPRWISVPQAPHPKSGSAARFNRSMASAAGRWREASDFSGKLVLPVIVGHQDLTNAKTSRNSLVSSVKSCQQASGAELVWVAEESLDDDAGSVTLETKRLPGLIALHQELDRALRGRSVRQIAGPYWAVNLVLWARRAVWMPAIGVGAGYRYGVAGFQPFRRAKVRIMLPPLRRRVVVEPGLRAWLRDAARAPGLPEDAVKPFQGLAENFDALSDSGVARQQVVREYGRWVSTLAAASRPDRGEALFDDLSRALKIGRRLGLLPNGCVRGQAARLPARIADQFLRFCIPAAT